MSKHNFLAFDLDLWPTILTYNPNLAKVNLQTNIKVASQTVQPWEQRQTDERSQELYLPLSLFVADSLFIAQMQKILYITWKPDSFFVFYLYPCWSLRWCFRAGRLLKSLSLLARWHFGQRYGKYSRSITAFPSIILSLPFSRTLNYWNLKWELI